jgi:hypothetical protein
MGRFARYGRALPLTAAVIIGAPWAAAYGADGEEAMESYKEVFDETWYDITVKEPIKLRKITDIDELDVTKLIVSKPVKK